MSFLKKKIFIFVSILILFLSLPYNAKSIPGPRRFTRLKVVGTSQYLGYLNAFLMVTKRGIPVNGLRIYLDKLKLNQLGGGNYSNGTPFHYKVADGKFIRISYRPVRKFPGIKPTRSKPVILGVYRIKNHIEWVFPLPESVISVRRLLSRSVKFRWNYTGAILKTKVSLKNFNTNTLIFQKTVTAESINIPVTLLKPGTKYRFDLEPVGPMGKFRLSRYTAPGSKIEFYYWDHLYFNVK